MEWNAFTRQYFTERETLVRWGRAAGRVHACGLFFEWGAVAAGLPLITRRHLSPSPLQPCSVLLLIDASIPPMPLDISCATWFVEAEVRTGVRPGFGDASVSSSRAYPVSSQPSAQPTPHLPA